MTNFATKDWKDSPDPTTPISQAALEDLETRLATYADTEDTALAGRYHMLVDWRAITIPQSTAAATLFLTEGATTGLAAATTLSPLAVVYIDRADYAFTLNALAAKWRVRAVCLTNATGPTVNFTIGLYPITAVAGGADAITMTAGTVTSGSTVLFTTQANQTLGQASSGDFAAPTAGFYALGVVISGTTAASSREVIAACVQARHA